MLKYIDEAFRGPSWHGPALLGSLRGIDAKRAAWRPSAGRHNIWEIVVHAAYWKYAVRRRLTGEKRGRFPLKGSNWFAGPSTPRRGRRAWEDDVKLLVEQHQRLREAVRRLPRRRLRAIVAHGRDTAAYTIRGIAAHDLYHAGQIQLLKRLMPKRS
jgi:DinB superfamily